MARKVGDVARELADREAIRDCLLRYGRGTDRCDRALLESVYWPDATDDHTGFFTGPVAAYLEQGMAMSVGALEQTQHLLGNMLIEIDGETAYVESYAVAFHRLRAEAGGGRPRDVLAGVRYLDRMAKRDDEWRILHRAVQWDWFREFADSADWDAGMIGLKLDMGGRFPDDRSYDYLGRRDRKAD